MRTTRLFLTLCGRSGAAVLLTAVSFGFFCEAAAAKSRGLRVSVQSIVGADGQSRLSEIQLYTDSYALVIGIDKYTGGWPALSNAVNDAEEVALVLEEQGFEVELRTDVDSENLERMIKGFFVRKGANPNARLLLWYAGHGHTIGGEGFLVPSDAPIGDDAEFKLTALHMRDFGSWVRLAESKHVLAIFDSCFSGTIFAASRGKPPAAITRAIEYPVRQFLTSGDAHQQVSDDGTFRELFVDALLGREQADLNRDGYITASELGLFLSQRVTRLTTGMQTPRYGKLRDKDYDRGDFVLSRRLTGRSPGSSLSSTPTQTSIQAPADETRDQSVFWESIRNSNQPRDYRAYLDRYPDGTFASLARIQLDRLDPVVPEFDVSALKPRDEQRWAATAANVRAEPAASAARVGGVSHHAAVRVTGEVQVGRELWYRVRLGPDQQGFVLGRLLAATQPPAAESGTAEEPSVSYGDQIQAARRARRENRSNQVSDLIQQRNVRSLKREKCQQSCASTVFRSQVERQPGWPSVRQRCEIALPNDSAYNQCVDRSRDQFEHRLRNECKQRC